MANMTFKASLLPNIDLGYSLGSETQRWNIYGNLTGNASTATKLETARTLTIGSTGKSFDGSADVSWSSTEILGSSTNSYFYRGDQTWANTLNGNFYANTIIATNTTTNGAQLGMRFSDKDYSMYGLIQTSRDANKGGYITFRHYAENSNGTLSGYSENYRFPSVTSGLTSNPTYYILTQKNYTDYTVTKTGSGASGTWGISISGNAATATKLANITLNSTTINNTAGSFAFSGSGEPWASTDWVGLQIGDGVDKFQIHALNGTHFEYRQNDSGGTNTSWGAWQTYVNRAGDTMSGNLTITHSDTSNSQFVATNSNGTVCLLASTNRGVYDITNNKWIIYLKVSNSTVRSDYPIYGAVWNDYAEYREIKEEIEPGRCVHETGKGDLVLTKARLQEGCEIVSDTFGFAIGESEKCKTPTAATGRVLAYLYEDRELAKPGRPVCSGPNGTVSLMTNEEAREYPWCIIGTISEIPNYEIWYAGSDGDQKIKVNGRIWIRIR